MKKPARGAAEGEHTRPCYSEPIGQGSHAILAEAVPKIEGKRGRGRNDMDLQPIRRKHNIELAQQDLVLGDVLEGGHR